MGTRVQRCQCSAVAQIVLLRCQTPCPCLLHPQAYKHYSKYATQALKAANLPKNMKNMKGDIPMNPRHMQQSLQKMSAALPPQLLKQVCV